MFYALHPEDPQLGGAAPPFTGLLGRATLENPRNKPQTQGVPRESLVSVGASVRSGFWCIRAQLESSSASTPACWALNRAQEKGTGETVAWETPAQRGGSPKPHTQVAAELWFQDKPPTFTGKLASEPQGGRPGKTDGSSYPPSLRFGKFGEEPKTLNF